MCAEPAYFCIMLNPKKKNSVISQPISQAIVDHLCSPLSHDLSGAEVSQVCSFVLYELTNLCAIVRVKCFLAWRPFIYWKKQTVVSSLSFFNCNQVSPTVLCYFVVDFLLNWGIQNLGSYWSFIIEQRYQIWIGSRNISSSWPYWNLRTFAIFDPFCVSISWFV